MMWFPDKLVHDTCSSDWDQNAGKEQQISASKECARKECLCGERGIQKGGYSLSK